MEPTKKNKYESPKIFRVVLKHDQAILSGCHASATSISNTTGTTCISTCRASTTTTTAANSTAGS